MPRPELNDPNAAENTTTVTLSVRDVRDAARLFRLISDPAVLHGGMPEHFPPAGPAADHETLVSRARIVFNARRLREHYFDGDIFGEPAWDILLLLFVADQSSGRLTASRLAEQIGTPLTTTARWLNDLEMKGLVARSDHPTDRRTIFIRLEDKARAALGAYLNLIPT